MKNIDHEPFVPAGDKPANADQSPGKAELPAGHPLAEESEQGLTETTGDPLLRGGGPIDPSPPGAAETEHQPNLPVRRIRHDGWTVARQEAFLKALAACGCVTHAAHAVGMSRQSAYDLHDRESAIAFRRAWEAALDCAIGKIDDGVISRSIHGVPRPIFYKGKQVGEWRHYDERLAMFLLRYRRPHRYCEPSQRWVRPRPPGCEDDGPDPDEALGTLSFQLEDLIDEADMPGGVSPGSCADERVNSVNFVGNWPAGIPNGDDDARNSGG
jgi:hypothetical protein